MTKNDQKADKELHIFVEFCDSAGVHPDHGSIASCVPPSPDLSFKLLGRLHYAELVEITDQRVARANAVATAEHRTIGGAYSQDAPLRSAFIAKADKRYEIDCAPLWLVAYYDKQFPATENDPGIMGREIGAIAEAMLNGSWEAVWVYDSWSRSVLFSKARPRSLGSGLWARSVPSVAGWFWVVWGFLLFAMSAFSGPAPWLVASGPYLTCFVYAATLLSRKRASIPFGWVMVALIAGSGFINHFWGLPVFQLMLLLQTALAVYITLVRECFAPSNIKMEPTRQESV